ncbi:MAG: protein kinase domain-containing protein [Hyalangium sp.]|uniref:protein kinase domain-containing protein n=1 Tax=Hyalangium sp. TaxID=2028555 RepID=UPI00389B2A4F
MNFGKYSILEHLGSGGMAEVYKCRLGGIGGFDKLVVVKRILPERLEEPEFIHMFLDEARIAANLNHPNVIHIFEVDEIDGAPYMAMEYVRGPTMAAMMRAAYRQKKVHLGHIAKVLADVCAGLYYVHNAKDQNGVPLQIIHRDISPQNILISVEGVPKLLDFGVAKAVGRLAQTEAGMFKGKLRYMAPDHVRGVPVDHRADIYSVGVCLYEAMTGRQRFPSSLNEAAVMATIMDGKVAPPSQVVENFPQELESIIMWALEPEPAQRCPSADALRQALEQFIASGGYASSAQAVAQWVAELFPPSETQSYGRKPAVSPGTGSASSPRTGSRPALGSAANSGSNSSIRALRTSGSSSGKLRMGQQPSQEEGAYPADLTQLEKAPSEQEEAPAKPVANAIVAVGTMVALLFGGSGVAYLATRKGAQEHAPATQAAQPEAANPQQASGSTAPPVKETPAPPVAPAPQAPPPAAPTAATLESSLEEAERLLKEAQYGQALELLSKVSEVQTTNPELSSRRVRLTTIAERESLLTKARMALELNDVPKAVETAKQVLDLEPNNPEALRLFSETKKLTGANANAAQRPRQRQRMGTLNLTVEPAAMVYLNDEPVGLSPLRQYNLPQGSHKVEVRLAGYVPMERTVQIQGNKATTLELALARASRPQDGGKPAAKGGEGEEAAPPRATSDSTTPAPPEPPGNTAAAPH